MPRFVLLCAGFAGCGLTCVYDDVVKPLPTPPASFYRRPRPSRPPIARPVHKEMKVATISDPAWLPNGRKISRRWRTIVIHHSATSKGGAKLFDKHHRRHNGWDELGYHFVIGNGTSTPDGMVEAGPRWHKQKHGAHCKTANNYYNEHGIGICLVGDFTRTTPTHRQLESLDRLVRFLSQRCGIPPSRVITHGEVTGKTECPGQRFPIASVRQSLGSPPTASSMP